MAEQLKITQQQVIRLHKLIITNAKITQEILQVLLNLRDKGVLSDGDFDGANQIKAEYDSNSKNPEGSNIQPEATGSDENSC